MGRGRRGAVGNRGVIERGYIFCLLERRRGYRERQSVSLRDYKLHTRKHKHIPRFGRGI